MAREKNGNGTPAESVISIIGPGMSVEGDCETDGTLRVEGTVRGTIKAGKAVVVGKDGLVDGDIQTQDAVVSGRTVGTVRADSRLELHASSRVEGQVFARRMQLEEGAVLNGTVHMGEDAVEENRALPAAASEGSRASGEEAPAAEEGEVEEARREKGSAPAAAPDAS